MSEVVPGSGKSVFIKSLLTSILKGIKCEVYLIDTKVVELASFRSHLKVKAYVYYNVDITNLIAELLQECHHRYQLMFESGVTNILDYNKLHPNKKLPVQFIIFEEFISYDNKQGQKLLRQLISLSRASGQFLILTAQRPDNTVIDNVLKANLSNRISFRTTTEANSKIILDVPGAELINIRGRFLYANDEYGLIEAQGYDISDKQIKEVLNPPAQHIQINQDNPPVKLINIKAKHTLSKTAINTTGSNSPLEDLQSL